MTGHVVFEKSSSRLARLQGWHFYYLRDLGVCSAPGGLDNPLFVEIQQAHKLLYQILCPEGDIHAINCQNCISFMAKYLQTNNISISLFSTLF